MQHTSNLCTCAEHRLCWLMFGTCTTCTCTLKRDNVFMYEHVCMYVCVIFMNMLWQTTWTESRAGKNKRLTQPKQEGHFEEEGERKNVKRKSLSCPGNFEHNEPHTAKKPLPCTLSHARTATCQIASAFLFLGGQSACELTDRCVMRCMKTLLRVLTSALKVPGMNSGQFLSSFFFLSHFFLMKPPARLSKTNGYFYHSLPCVQTMIIHTHTHHITCTCT
jgi:hypothetical protein